MKIRTGFVSNSSSSSFVCQVCGRQESGMDMMLEDAEMAECINGHVICIDELLDEVKSNANKESCENYDEDSFTCKECEDCEDCEDFSSSDDEIAEKYCPVCQWKAISEDDFSAYLLKEYKIPRDEVFKIVKKENKRRKKLYNSEYVNYVCLKNNLNRDIILVELSKRFKTYSDYLEYIE